MYKESMELSVRFSNEFREFWGRFEVEAVPPGYPILFDFLPDIDGSTTCGRS
jgi:acetone carboxylase gamma subunit